MATSSVCSTRQPSIFVRILLGNAIYGTARVLPCDTDCHKHRLEEITQPLCTTVLSSEAYTLSCPKYSLPSVLL